MLSSYFPKNIKIHNNYFCHFMSNSFYTYHRRGAHYGSINRTVGSCQIWTGQPFVSQFNFPSPSPSLPRFPCPGIFVHVLLLSICIYPIQFDMKKIKIRPFQGLNPRPQDFLCKSQGRGGEGGSAPLRCAESPGVFSE